MARPSRPAPAPRRGATAYYPSATDSRRRAIALAIVGAGVLVAILVVLFSVEQRSPAPAAQQTAGSQNVEANLAALQQRLAQNPTDLGTMITLGNTLYDAKRYPEAINWYEKALELAPTNTDVRTDLGTAYFYSGNNDKAKEQWGKVLAQDPKKIQAHFNLGVLYSGLTPPDNEAAAREWETVIQIDPTSPDAKAAEQRLKQIGKR